MNNAYIKDIAFYVPDKILTNDDLSKLMDTSDEWISTRTGIKKRHVVGDSGLGPVDLAVKASDKLLNKLNMEKADIDLINSFLPGNFVSGKATGNLKINGKISSPSALTFNSFI